ncbi:metallophosphoesterase [Jiulongibacter sp. NS-SX5]|uniref:metallophosphoesterase n=1 Tax=Jiulongibacter sp. NS-SX5 TaxID=3463854 RepID=UPI0040582380
MGRSLFITLFLGLFVLADVYIYAAIRQLTKAWSASAQRTTAIIYWAVPIVCILIFVLTFFVLNDRLPFKLRNFLASFIFIIYLSKLLTAALLIVGDIIKYVKAGYHYLLSKIDSTPETTVDNSSKITRSEFITKTALTLGAAHIGAMSYGIISGAHDYRIRRVPLKLNNLPQKFHGLKLAQISDIHSGSFFNKTAVSGGIDMLLGEKPDLVFFTGDLVNNKAEELSDYFDVFKRIQAPLGVYSTLGNHDYGDYTSWSSPQEKQLNLETLKEGHKLMGWNLMMDEHKRLKVEGEEIGIVGIQNWGQGFHQYGDLKKALTNTDDLPVKLLLSHDPSHWRAQVLGQSQVDVSFAGHTHGMQYGVEVGPIKWSPVQWRYKEWAGLYQEGNQQLYVNRGYGYLGYPGRLGILPEITIFELQKV